MQGPHQFLQHWGDPTPRLPAEDVMCTPALHLRGANTFFHGQETQEGSTHPFLFAEIHYLSFPLYKNEI